MPDPIPPARQEILINASPERVYDAWADPDEIARWYVERQVGDPRTDNQITWYVNPEDLDGPGEPLQVTVGARGERLILENVGAKPWRGSVIDVDLSPSGSGTHLRLTQRGFSEPLRAHAPVVNSGWACVLAILKEYLERHPGQPRSVAAAHRAVDPDPAAVAAALASPASIAAWAGAPPTRLLAATPHGAVAAFPDHPGLFTLMGAGGAVVWYNGWDEPDLTAAQAKADNLAARLAAHIQRPS